MAKKKEISGYNSNQSLKRASQPIEWTSEMVKEYVRCSGDVTYFTEKYMKIINLDEGLISFKLRPYQKTMLKSMSENRFTILCCARQAGKCLQISTPIKLRNKKTGEVRITTIGELYGETKKAD